MVPGRLETVFDDVALLGAAVGEPATERQDLGWCQWWMVLDEDSCVNIR